MADRSCSSCVRLPLAACVAAVAVVIGAGRIGLAQSLPGQSFPLSPPQNAPYGAPPAGPPTNVLPPEAALPAPSRQLVVEVQVLGNSGTKDYEIQKHIHTRQDREFDPELVQADVRRLVTTGLFRDVKTFTRPAPGGVVVIFEVFERPRIHEIKYLGNRALSEKALNKEIGLKKGDPLNAYSCDEARRKIEELYHSKGHPTASVSLLEGDQPGDKNLVFLINEGQIERVAYTVFEGNTIASDQRLKTQIESKPGFLWYFFKGKVDRAKIDGDVEKLTAYYRSLGYFFADVQADPRFLEEPGQLDLVYRIDEGDVFSVSEINVNIAGEFPHTRQTVVLNRLGFRPGDVLDTRKIRDAERRLKSSQLFTVNPQEGEPPKIVVRPPDASSIEAMANQPPPRTIRGQDPGPVDVVDRHFPPIQSRRPAAPISQPGWSQYR